LVDMGCKTLVSAHLGRGLAILFMVKALEKRTDGV